MSITDTVNTLIRKFDEARGIAQEEFHDSLMLKGLSDGASLRKSKEIAKKKQN